MLFLEAPSWRYVVSLFAVGDLEQFGIQKLKLIQEADSCLGTLLSPCLLGIITYTCIFIICIITYNNIFIIIFGLAWSTCVGKIENSAGQARAVYSFFNSHTPLFQKTEIMPISVLLLYVYFLLVSTGCTRGRGWPEFCTFNKVSELSMGCLQVFQEDTQVQLAHLV